MLFKTVSKAVDGSGPNLTPSYYSVVSCLSFINSSIGAINKLEEIEPKAVLRALENTEGAKRATESKKQGSLVFSIQHSRDNIELKKLIRDLEPDIKKICGDI